MEAKCEQTNGSESALRQLESTYIVQVGLHVDQSEGFLEKDNKHSTGNPILVEAVFVHIRLLRKGERRVLKA